MMSKLTAPLDNN